MLGNVETSLVQAGFEPAHIVRESFGIEASFTYMEELPRGAVVAPSPTTTATTLPLHAQGAADYTRPMSPVVRATNTPVGIVGMGCILPGCVDRPSLLWEALSYGPRVFVLRSMWPSHLVQICHTAGVSVLS